MRRRLLVVAAGIALTALAAAGLVAFAGRSSTSKNVSFRDSMYMGGVQLTRSEVEGRLGRLRAAASRVEGKDAFVSGGRPPRYLALLRPDGRYDVYELMR